MKIKKSIFVFIFAALIFAYGCGTKTQPVTEEAFLLDTVVSVTIYSYEGDVSAKELISDCFEYCREYEKKYSRTIPDSIVSQINGAGGKPVEIDSEAKYLFEKSIFYCEKTNGAFDITISPVSSMWDFHNKNAVPPDSEEIKNKLSHVGYGNIILDNTAITLKDPDAAVDLGGIAKGFIADRAKEYLVSRGVTSAILNFGGNIVAIGSNPDGRDFVIGVKYTLDSDNPDKLYINDRAIATSSSLERSFEYDGKKYHHILDTATGYPVENDIVSVTVMTDSAVDADALSTACFILGTEGARDLIKEIPDTEVLFIMNGNEKIRIES